MNEEEKLNFARKLKGFEGSDPRFEWQHPPVMKAWEEFELLPNLPVHILFIS